MALGLLLCVSWICLLVNGSLVFPPKKVYRVIEDSKNLNDDGDDDALTSPGLDQNNLQALYNHQPGAGWRGNNHPLFAYWQNLVSSQPNTQSVPTVQGPVQGESRGWGLLNLHRPLLFPLRPNQQAEPQTPTQEQSPGVHTGNGPVNPSSGDSGNYASQAASQQPVSSPTVQDSWRPGPVDSNYGVVHFSVSNQDSNSGSSAHGGDQSNRGNLVFERVFQYPNNVPSQGSASNPAAGQGQGNYLGGGSSAGYSPTGQQKPPSNAAVPSFFDPWRRLPSAFYYGGGNYNVVNYRPRNTMYRRPRVGPAQRVQPVRRVSAPTGSRQRRPTYFSRYKTGYRRGRFIQSKSIYQPQSGQNVMMSFTSVQEPAQSQPPAQKA